MYEVYKALSKRGEQLVSYNIAKAWESRYELKYKFGMTTIPTIKNSLLFAFLDKEEAFRMIKGNYSDADVYLARTPWYITGIIPQTCVNEETDKTIERFWANYKTPADSYTDKRMTIMESFKTSICCPSLEIIRKVDRV